MHHRKLPLLICTVSTLIIASTLPANSASIAGTKCTVLNSTKVIGNLKYTCIKQSKKMIWNKGVVFKKPETSSLKPDNLNTYNPIGSKNGVCPAVNAEANALIAIAKKEVQDKSLPSFVTLEIESGALTPEKENQYRSAIAAGSRFATSDIPIKYFIPKSKTWFLERWPNFDTGYINQVLTDSNDPFPAHSLGDEVRYAVAGSVGKGSEPYAFVQMVSIVLKPKKEAGTPIHWYSHSFGGPFGAAISEALGIACYKTYRDDVLKLAKEMGPDPRKNINWDVDHSGWYQGFLINEYLTGKLGIKTAQNLIPDPNKKSEVDNNFKNALGMNLNEFYDFIAERLTGEFK